MFGRKCSSPGYGFVSVFFLAALSGSLHCGKTLGPEKSFEYGKVFQEYGWETRTFEEGKKKAPLIQGGGWRQAHTIEKVENPSSRLLIKPWLLGFPLNFQVPNPHDLRSTSRSVLRTCPSVWTKRGVNVAPSDSATSWWLGDAVYPSGKRITNN